MTANIVGLNSVDTFASVCLGFKARPICFLYHRFLSFNLMDQLVWKKNENKTKRKLTSFSGLCGGNTLWLKYIPALLNSSSMSSHPILFFFIGPMALIVFLPPPKTTKHFEAIFQSKTSGFYFKSFRYNILNISNISNN